jgi:hypothetical protein
MIPALLDSWLIWGNETELKLCEFMSTWIQWNRIKIVGVHVNLNPLKANGQSVDTLIFIFVVKVFVPKEIRQSSKRVKTGHKISHVTDM